jgi:predicted secreted protein
VDNENVQFVIISYPDSGWCKIALQTSRDGEDSYKTVSEFVHREEADELMTTLNRYKNKLLLKEIL